MRIKTKGRCKLPDKVYPINRIGDLHYIVKIPMDNSEPFELTLTEFKYLHDCYVKFAKQSGFRGFK